MLKILHETTDGNKKLLFLRTFILKISPKDDTVSYLLEQF